MEVDLSSAGVEARHPGEVRGGIDDVPARVKSLEAVGEREACSADIGLGEGWEGVVVGVVSDYVNLVGRWIALQLVDDN